jgi:integrase
VLPYWKTRDAPSIERGDVIELVERLVTAGKPVAANRVQSLVSKIFSFGIDAGTLKFNPCFRMEKRGTERVGRRVLSDPEIRLFWNRIVERPASRRIGLGLRLALLTGCRVGEIAGLCRDELEHIADGDRSAWVIPGERTKNKKDHLVPLVPLARDTILDLLAMIEPGEQYLLLTRSRRRRGSIRSNSLTQNMANFADRLSGDDDAIRTWKTEVPSPHDLRRTLETRLAGLRIPKEIRDRVLNHAPGDVGSKHYNLHDYADEKREALGRWASVVDSIVAGTNAAVVSIAAARDGGRR